ncbi:ketoacyl-ACP synthase III [Paenibacillus sp. HN-1]|uniref:3-oxoacyl-ACP synthase III family protein n=1 Tax=Paenibacillus TaxID=44249 RepID=UPI001CA8E959|nr:MULTISPECIES: ketoacyl-ACP synthase III [Paenibacillus]MBY9080756.1 ketoacyl-ACP synthase III [Paenibacillus sp. CGMCC 1.18879]MBY9085252.1 ketoacyl-ACP synthase III [Paenibacillus sinensis]
MPKGAFRNVAITGVSTAVPSYSKCLDEEVDLFGSQKNIDKLKRITGLHSRRIANEQTTSLDLCVYSAERLLEAMKLDRSGIDGVVFVTQTPDHRIPNNASLVHGMLGLERDCLCFDINHGCSGYIYGLINSFSLIESGMCRRILLLVGDTLSKVINPRDKSLSIIHGDAGTATIVEYTEQENESSFILYSDGSKAKAICVEAGAYRKMSCPETAIEQEDSEGNHRSPEQLYMNGLEVFNFALQHVPPLVNEAMTLSRKTMDDIDLFVFHQANGIINRGIIDKLSIPLEKAPTDVIRDYGNSSCATIPHVLSSALGNSPGPHELSLMLTGFGVGLSLAACVTKLNDAVILPVLEYDRI